MLRYYQIIAVQVAAVAAAEVIKAAVAEAQEVARAVVAVVLQILSPEGRVPVEMMVLICFLKPQAEAEAAGEEVLLIMYLLQMLAEAAAEVVDTEVVQAETVAA